ncbi:MAG: 30S ribosomal protein S20 [Bacteroidales bacterium]
MANHKSALKRIRQTETRRKRNRYHAKTMRNALQNFRNLKDKKEAEEKLSGILSMIDKLAAKQIIHKNKASNLKSKIHKQYQKMT